MKKIILVLLQPVILFVSAQGQETGLQKEINEQVWKPFISSFSSGDNKLFSSVHSKEVIRVIQDNNQVIGYEQYFKEIPDSLKTKWAVWKKNIELRFIQRIADDGKAFEVGYYKTTSTNQQTGEIRKSIGKFHVLMRKENGRWKILMDADTGEGATEELFNKANPLE